MHDWQNDKAMEVRDELTKVCRTLEGRAGEPNEMTSRRSEAMRCKLEKRLLPKLRKEIPEMVSGIFERV